MSAFVILGVDPGYTHTGLCALRVDGTHGYVLIAARQVEPAKRLEPNARVAWIAAQVYDFAEANNVARAVIEDQANVSTAKITEGHTSAAALRGRDVANRVCGVLDTRGRGSHPGRADPVLWVTPFQAKKAVTGFAHAGKKQVERAVNALVRGVDSRNPLRSHEADAAAIAIAGARMHHVKNLYVRRTESVA